MQAVRILAPAKVNLRLHVLGREAAGYHSLETIFCALSLADELEIRHADAGIDLRVSGGIGTGPAEHNLAVRAARRFYEGIGVDPAVAIRLEKRIPSAAGLGGGSSDAAATLRALNTLHGDPVDPESLLRWGAEIGSDVPFFLAPTPYALAWGRGERILALPPLPPRPVLLAHPGVDMPTSTVFRRLAERRGPDHRVDAVAIPFASLARWESVAHLAENDLEELAHEQVSTLRAVLAALREAGAGIALLAGSGASAFGVFPSESARDGAETRVAEVGWDRWRTHTLGEWPTPQPRD